MFRHTYIVTISSSVVNVRKNIVVFLFCVVFFFKMKVVIKQQECTELNYNAQEKEKTPQALF